MVKDIYSSGPDTEEEGSQEISSGRTEAAKGQRGNGSDNFQRQSAKEKIQVKAAGDLLCFYINARNCLINLMTLKHGYIILTQTLWE